VVIFSVFPPLVTDIVLAAGVAGQVEKVPVWEFCVESLAVRVNVPIVIVWPVEGLPEKVPSVDAAVGALASNVTPSTVNVELLEMLPLRDPMGAVTLPAAPLPRGVLQSFFTPSPKMLRGGLPRRGIGFRSHEPPGPKPRSGSATTGRVPKVRFACCNW